MIKQIDPVFYIFGVLTIFFILVTIFVLKKSFSTVNNLFSLTPLTFALVIILNMLGYFIAIPAIIPRIPYLLAPLGIFFAGVFIFFGHNFIKDYKIMSFIVLYTVYTVLLSFYLELNTSLFFSGLLHLSVIFPLLPSLYYYFRLTKVIPESANSIFTMLLGLFIAILGALPRSYYFFTVSFTSDFVPGLILIFLGIIIIIISFTAFSGKKTKFSL